MASLGTLSGDFNGQALLRLLGIWVPVVGTLVDPTYILLLWTPTTKKMCALLRLNGQMRFSTTTSLKKPGLLKLPMKWKSKLRNLFSLEIRILCGQDPTRLTCFDLLCCIHVPKDQPLTMRVADVLQSLFCSNDQQQCCNIKDDIHQSRYSAPPWALAVTWSRPGSAKHLYLLS